MINFDEMDHISAVYFMSQGQQLYKDIITTHFPFPFYWAYLFSSFWTHPPFARAITNLHFSLVLFYLITFVLVYFSLKKNSFKRMFSIWILFTSLIIALYHGNLYLSETFTGISLAAILWILLPIFLDKQKLTPYSKFLLIIFASISTWTQPLSVLLLLIPILLTPKKEFFKTTFQIFIINIIPLTALILSGQFVHFFNHTVIFNFTIYSHNFPEQTGNNSMFVQNISDFFNHQFYTLTHFFNSTQIYQFLLNIALIIFSVLVLWKAKFVYKISYILLFLSLMSRQVKVTPGKIFSFGMFPIILFSFICLISLFYFKKSLVSKMLIITTTILCFVFVIKDNLPIFKQSLNSAYNYHVFWSPRENIGKMISDLTLSTEKILIYPHDPDLYFFSQRLSLDGFTYWYPWYDQSPKLKQIRLSALNQNPPALIYLGSLAYKDDPALYSTFFPNLLSNYLPVFDRRGDTHIWIRNDLKDRINTPYSLTEE